MTRELWRGPLLALAAVGALTVLFFTCFERTEKEVSMGASREARQNPYLGLERLLARMQHPVHSVESLSELMRPPDAPGTLWLLVGHDSLPEEAREALLDWVAAGGHLVIAADPIGPPEARRAAPLFDRVGLVRVEAEDEAEDEDEAEGAADEPTEGEIHLDAGVDVRIAWGEHRETVSAPWPGTEDPLEVQFAERFVWQETGAPVVWVVWALSGASGPHLMMLRHGEGRVTALTDAGFLQNDHLATADHAELALHLARWDGGRRPVWVVPSDEWPGLLALATRHAAPVLLAGAVFLAAWLWRVSRRFGPLEPLPPPERRRWLEHLEAVGQYHWRRDRAQGLLESARQRALQRLEGRRPGWARARPDVRDRHVAGLTGLSPDQVGQALREAGPVRSPVDFVTTIAHLERIRAAL